MGNGSVSGVREFVLPSGITRAVGERRDETREPVPAAVLPPLASARVGGRWRMARTYLIADMACLLLSFELAMFIRDLFGGAINPLLYSHLLPNLLLFVLAYAVAKLYPSVGFSPVEEVRRQSLATSAVFLAIAASSFMLRGGEAYSRGMYAP